MSQQPSSPPPGPAPLAMMLIGVGTRLREHLDDRLSAFDITMRHFGALGHLAGSPELSTSDLARRVRVTPQSMRATVDHLEAIGAVEHRRHGQGKASELVVTDNGHQLLENARMIVDGLDTELLGHIDDHDALRTALMATMFELRSGQQPDGPI